MPTMRETMSRMLSSRMAKASKMEQRGNFILPQGAASWHHACLPALERRQFVFVLLLLPANKPLLQETLGQVSAPHAECDGQAEHQGSEGNSEGNQHGLLCQTQFFKGDRQYENNEDAAESEAQNPG